VAEAGAFAVVAEGVMEGLADELTAAVPVPVIGIGASANCDGQVLVTEDMLGLFERTPRFVKRYDDLASRISEAVGSYAADVRARSFPTADQTYRPKA
jgi:3-methyl-2-oxobutanoate hydroxymethyltransferase